MTIIQQAMEIITKSYGENLEKTLRGESDFGAMVLSFEEELRKAGTILVQGIMKTLDEEIREHPHTREVNHNGSGRGEGGGSHPVFH